MPMPNAQHPAIDAFQTLGLDELRQQQLERLRWSLDHAYRHVPFYRQRFNDWDIHPDKLKSLDDLSQFPFTSKADLRDNYPFGMFAVPQQHIVRLHASSGTTGKPTVVGYTQKDIDTWADLVARSIYVAGGRPGEKVHVAYGYGLFTGGLGAHYGAERLGCTVIPVSGGQTARQVQLLQDLKPEIIMVTPSYMLNIADEIERQGIPRDQLALRLGILGAEPWTDEMRSALETRLGITALDIYGLSEIMGPGVAMECVQDKNGASLWEDHFYPEIIDPQTTAVLPDGELGELVLTSLSKEALPMIRYRTRDMTRLLPGTCNAMRRLERITGRSDDMLIVRGVNVFPTQIEEQILKIIQFAEAYEIHLSREGNMDQMQVHVELRSGYQYSQAENHNVLCEALAQRIKAHVGISAHIVLQPTYSIKRSEGKACRVIDHRPGAPKTSKS